MKHLPIHPTKPIDLHTPGAIDQLIAYHRQTFGGWTMEADDESDDTADETSDDADDKADDDKAEDKPDEHRQATREAAKFRRELKPWKDLSKELNLTPEQMRAAIAKGSKPAKDDDDVEKIDADEIRRQAKVEAREESDAKLIRAEVRTLAAAAFTNPADALHNLDLSDYEVDDDGELVDAKQVKADLAQVLKDNPHYSKTGKAPKADPSQGSKGDQKADPGPGIARLRQAYTDTSK